MKVTAIKIRLVILVIFGVFVVVVARPAMHQIMLIQESQKAKVNVAPPEKTVSMEPVQALGIMPGAGKSGTASKGSEAGSEDVGALE